MIELAFIIFYGMALIGGGFMAYVWGKVAYKGVMKSPGHALDQFCMVSLGLCIGAMATVIIFGARLGAALLQGIYPTALEPIWAGAILFGMVILASSKWVLMWAHDPCKHSRTWRLFLACSIAWVLAAPFLWWGRD